MENGFEAKAGCEFEAKIEPCILCEDNQRDVTPEDGVAAGGISDTQPNTEGDVYRAMGNPQGLTSADLFPNPTDGPLTMSTDGMAEAVFVHDMTGHIVGGWHLDALTETSVTLDVSALRSGPYLLTVTTATGTCTARFLRK